MVTSIKGSPVLNSPLFWVTWTKIQCKWTWIKGLPVLSSHFLSFPWVTPYDRFDCKCLKLYMYLLIPIHTFRICLQISKCNIFVTTCIQQTLHYRTIHQFTFYILWLALRFVWCPKYRIYKLIWVKATRCRFSKLLQFVSLLLVLSLFPQLFFCLSSTSGSCCNFPEMFHFD